MKSSHKGALKECIFCGAVVAQWIRPQTLNLQVLGSNLTVAVVTLGQDTLSSCLVT